YSKENLAGASKGYLTHLGRHVMNLADLPAIEDGLGGGDHLLAVDLKLPFVKSWHEQLPAMPVLGSIHRVEAHAEIIQCRPRWPRGRDAISLKHIGLRHHLPVILRSIDQYFGAALDKRGERTICIVHMLMIGDWVAIEQDLVPALP